MATKTIHTLCLICVIVYTAGVRVNIKTEEEVIRFYNNDIIPPGEGESWVWRRDTGLWGVKFLHVRLQSDDHLLVNYNHDVIRIHDPSLIPNGRLDTLGPFLNITFIAGQSSSTGRSFEFDVRYGKSQADLHAAFINTQTTAQPAPEDLSSLLPLLVTLVVIVPLLFLALVLVFICHRRRQRRQQQQVSLTVNVQEGIRRDSGVRYTRKTSTQSQSEEPTSPTRKTSQVSRSNSQRSWMVRAELSATTSTTVSTVRPAGSSRKDGHVRAQPNWYVQTEALGKAQMKPEVQPVGHAQDGQRETIRKMSALERVLERVPESGMMVVPASPQDKPVDDGYLGPSPSFSSSSYLDMGDGKNYQNTPPAKSCGAEYQNITVTGIVGV